jgi:cell division septation protein DedD
MDKDKDDRTQADQAFLNEELESLYRKVAEERLADAASFKDVPLDESEFRHEPGISGYKTPAAKAGRGLNGANAVAKFLMFFVPAFLILGFAFFIWPTPYDHTSIRHGGKKYLVKTNRFTDSKSYFYNGRWLTALPSDISLRMPDPLSIKSPGDTPRQITPPMAEDAIESKEETPKSPPDAVQPQAIPAATPDPASLAEGPNQELAVHEAEPVIRPQLKSQAKTAAKPKVSTRTKSLSSLDVAVQPPVSAKKKSAKQALSKSKPYTIQVGAFRSEDDLNAFMQEHKRRSDMHWARARVKDQIWYRAFIGRFADQAAARQYMKKKKIDAAYPGCFVQKSG